MRTNHSLNLSPLIAAVAITAGATNTFGASSLSVIPTLSGDTVNEGRAITPDGQYIVGLSGSRGFLYQLGAGSAINVLSSDNAQSLIANGVGYRTSGGQTQLIISGNTSSGAAEYMTADGGTTFGVKRRNANYVNALTMGAVNQLGSALGSDVYYVSSTTATRVSNVTLNQGSGTWVPVNNTTFLYSIKGISGDTSLMNGVGASGRAVGYRTQSGVRNNYMLTYAAGTPTATFFAGLAGNNVGEAFSVSADGSTVFGQSPITVGGTVNWGYVAKFSGTTETSITRLPFFGTENNPTSQQVPYGCTADGSYAVGMDYLGVEKATLWSVKSDNPFIIDLTQYATDNGLLDGFTRLSRAYSVGETFDITGQEYAVVTGVGVYGGVSRGFVMTVMIPEPTTISLLALGGFFLLIQRRRK